MFTRNIKAWETRVEYQKSRREEAGEIDTEKKLSYTQAEAVPSATAEPKA